MRTSPTIEGAGKGMEPASPQSPDSKYKSTKKKSLLQEKIYMDKAYQIALGLHTAYSVYNGSYAYAAGAVAGGAYLGAETVFGRERLKEMTHVSAEAIAEFEHATDEILEKTWFKSAAIVWTGLFWWFKEPVSAFTTGFLLPQRAKPLLMNLAYGRKPKAQGDAGGWPARSGSKIAFLCGRSGRAAGRRHANGRRVPGPIRAVPRSRGRLAT